MPIVAVPKSDGRIRICRDYKVTVNPHIEPDRHPLPKPDDLFASLSGGKKFTKIDLSHAYLQIMLDDESKEFMVINTQGIVPIFPYAFWHIICASHFSVGHV